MSQDELSARLRAHNVVLDRSAIDRIESGKRRLRVDDLVALAVALNTSPAALLTPQHAADEVAVTPTLTATGTAMREWLALRPAVGNKDHPVNVRAFHEALPDGTWQAWQHPFIAELFSHYMTLEMLVSVEMVGPTPREDRYRVILKSIHEVLTREMKAAKASEEN